MAAVERAGPQAEGTPIGTEFLHVSRATRIQRAFGEIQNWIRGWVLPRSQWV